MAEIPTEAAFERQVDALSADLVEAVRYHMNKGAGADVVLEALAAVLGTTLASTVSSVDDLERNVEIASLRIQQTSDDAFMHQAASSGPAA